MRRHLTPWRIAGAVVGLLLLTVGALYLAPSSDYILLPDPAHPVAPLVRVQGGRDPRGPGQIYFVDVFERRASELESLFPWIHDGATLVPAKLLVPPGVTDKAAREADLRSMRLSQQVAAAVALRKLGYKIAATPSGVIVGAIETESHAVGVLRSGDVITAVGGVPTPTIRRLRAQIDKLKPGRPATLQVERGSLRLTLHVKTIADALQHGRPIVGFTPDQAAKIGPLPLNVQIDAGNVGGPSAGLAFALEVMAELGRDVTHGYRVAATGQLELDGSVSPIGGVRQKIFGVRRANVDVFLVPAGQNAAVARRDAGGVKVIPVGSLSQALRALAALPPKR